MLLLVPVFLASKYVFEVIVFFFEYLEYLISI